MEHRYIYYISTGFIHHIKNFVHFFLFRDGSACLSYNLDSEKSNNTPTDEDWVPYKQMPSGSENIMSLRQEQLGVRIRECQAALDNLQKINEGKDIGQHVLLSSIDLKSFKVNIETAQFSPFFLCIQCVLLLTALC